MNCTFLYCLFCILFCAVCISQSRRNKQLTQEKVAPLKVSKKRFFLSFAIFCALTMFLPSVTLVTLCKLLPSLEIAESNLLVLSMFISQSIIAFFIFRLRKHLRLGNFELSFKQVSMFGLQKFGCVLPIVLLASVLWVSFLLLLKNCGFNISLNEQEAVILFLGTNGVFFKALFCLLAVFIAPFIEEYVFRAGVYRVLKQGFGIKWAAIFTSFLFAAMHCNLVSLIPLFVLSLYLIKFYEQSDDIRASIIIHGAFNFNSVVLMILSTGM